MFRPRDTMHMGSSFLHSTPISVETAIQAGVFTTLPARKSKYSDVADQAARRARCVLQSHASDDQSKQALGATVPSLSPVGNIFAYLTPEALPERMSIYVFLSEFGIIYDDFCEPLGRQESSREYEILEKCFSLDFRPCDSGPIEELSLHKILAEELLDLIQIDRHCGIRVIELYQQWAQDVRAVAKMDTYDRFIEHRLGEFGMGCWWALLEFALGLSLTDKERQLTDHIFKTGSELLLLCQDYWSWEKEYTAWQTNGTRIKNAIEVFSRTEGLSFDNAKEKVKSRILELEQVYLQQRSQFNENYPESDSPRAWIDAVGYCIGGYNYWAANSPRYHGQGHEVYSGNPQTSPSCKVDTGRKPTQISAPHEVRDRHVSIRSLGPPQCQTNKEAELSSMGQILPLSWKKPDSMALTAPCKYIMNLPSKGMRSMLITAFNDWIGAPNRSVTLVENIIRLLHNGSLLIDDIQDNSPVRRGKPAAHTIYGIPQVLNTGLFMFTQAVQEAKTLNNPESTDILLENLQCLYLGQSWELYWKHNLSCPTESDYLNMVDNKTGGMFRMLVQLLIAEQSTVASAVERERLTIANFDHLLLLLGRYYQIRDDYMNLKSTRYSEQKGFCEDLDEGKYSFPIVWLLVRKPEYRGYINGVFRQLPVGMGQEPRLSRENKLDILAILEATGSLRATLDLLKELESALELEITRLEGILSKKNAMMRVIIAALSVNHV